MNEEVARRVGRLVDALGASGVARDVLAVVVVGSAARGEERWADGRLLSDIDVMVVSRSSPARIDRTLAVERLIADHAADGTEGGRIPVSTLRYATLANYEARHRGVVVSGDPSVLHRVPLAGPRDLPAWEAARLTANRLFEHLKHLAGTITAESAVLKSYEAIGEAQLVLEGRYRPTFGERAAEISRHPLEGPVAGAGRLYAQAEGVRRGTQAGLEASPEQALRDLLLQLEESLRRVSGRVGGLEEQLALLARTERHLSHRAYWMLRGLGRRDRDYRPTQDPIVRLWRRAAGTLSGTTERDDPAHLVQLWAQCPQILRSPAGG